jgi:L-seryl-tRNA(Ser) seleniumtransferase
MSARTTALRALPAVDRLLRHPEAEKLAGRYPRDLIAQMLREALGEARAHLANGRVDAPPSDEELVRAAASRLAARLASSLRPVVNASGVVLHTNLGRAALAPQALEAVRAAAGASNLEYDLATGSRSDRDFHVEEHLRALAGAEAATAVNNNAAAVLLALDTLAEGREVVVSRGELIEIGGSFRIPEILAKSGALMREVGTTNRTHPSDYERALGPQTALLLKVHPSNYRIEGFTADVPLRVLVELGGRHGLPVMEDLGSGALVDLSRWGLPREPVVADSVRCGADVVTFSGDKLLGGPQAGLLVGRREAIERMRRNPLKRALRCDKMTLAALEATLRLYGTAPDLAAAIPTLRALTRGLDELERLGRAVLPLLAAALGAEYRLELVAAESRIGSGAQPTETIPSRAIAIAHPSIGPLEVAARFRAAHPPIVGRVHDDRFCLDLRCIERPEEIVPG